MTGREPGRATVRQHTRRTAHGTTTVRRHTRRTAGARVEPGAGAPPAGATRSTAVLSVASFGQAAAAFTFALLGFPVAALFALVAAAAFGVAAHASRSTGRPDDDEGPRYTTAAPPPADDEDDDEEPEPDDQHDPDPDPEGTPTK